MLFYVCNIIINYNSKCIHPSRGARLMFCWTDFCFPWHQDQRGYKKYILHRTRLSLAHTAIVSSGIIFIFFSICWLDSRKDSVKWDFNKNIRILNQILLHLIFFWFFILSGCRILCMYILLNFFFCNLNFSDSEDINMIIGWSRRSLDSSGVSFWRQIVFLIKWVKWATKNWEHIKHNLRFRYFYLLIKCHISSLLFMFVQIPSNKKMIVEI